jgi:hypothetical protein
MAKPNLIVLGCSGGVGRGTLTYLKRHAARFGSITLVDKEDFHDDRFVSIGELGAKFIKMEVDEQTEQEYAKLLKETEAGIVLDVSEAPTSVAAGVVFDQGVASYVCTGYCDEAEGSLSEVAGPWLEKAASQKHRKPHVLFSGMNPGIVNVLAAMGVKKFGKPRDITEFEYDTSQTLREPLPNGVTWSLEQFVDEAVKEPAQVALGRNRARTFYPNGIEHPEDMEPILGPLLDLSEYPHGWTIMHEECLTLSHKYDVPCRFIYAVNRRTRDFVEKRYRAGKTLEDSDLDLMNNIKRPLVGSDLVGVRLDYADRVVFYFNRKHNINLKGSSATIYQVAVGVHAALFTLLLDRLEPGVKFTEDLVDAFYPTFVTDNLMIEEQVFTREKDGRLRLESSDPHMDWGERQFIRM